MRDMKIRHRKMWHNLAAVENTGHEMRNHVARVKNARHENAINGECGKLRMDKGVVIY